MCTGAGKEIWLQYTEKHTDAEEQGGGEGRLDAEWTTRKSLERKKALGNVVTEAICVEEITRELRGSAY